ncbi:XVIPCD domain-containing protein [Solilutibacter silvestris]|uniref:XVIPCD domain-containing protein n=1 Tax=Solilutibacter silvestris TaxID=1645665 RepID=UPI003D352AA6
MPEPVVELERLTIPEFSLGIAREPGSERLGAQVIEPEQLCDSDLPLAMVAREHRAELLAKANRMLDATMQETVGQNPSRRSGAVASMQTQFLIDQYLHYLGWAKTHPVGELRVDGVDRHWGRAQTNALVETLEERLKQLGMHGDRPTRDSGHTAFHSHADLAQSLVARIPAAAITRMAAGVRAEDVAYALAEAGRREGFVPTTPVSVVSSSDGSRVFAVQGDLVDPASMRVSLAVDQVRPGTAAALRASLACMDENDADDVTLRPAMQPTR